MRILLLLVLTTLAGCSQPDFHDINGDGISLTELREKTLIVNYWATWCAPCIKEIPELNELAHSRAAELNLLGVNFDQPSPEEHLQQAKKMKIDFPVFAVDPAAQLGVKVPLVLPTTYIFAPGGELLATLVGPQTQTTILEAANL